MNAEIRPMVPADYDESFALWSACEGLSLGDDDQPDGIALYLRYNTGLCFVAVSDGSLVGTVLAGHDGRRGILRHLVVRPDFRRQGLGRRLVRCSLDALAAAGIRKCNLFVMDHNPAGRHFWEQLGFRPLPNDYRTLQLGTGTPFAAPGP
jgi:ribosomal protein S18 acetylase RimI-like enzyme